MVTRDIISLIIGSAALIGSIVGVWIRMEKRQERVSSNIDHLQSQLDRIEKQFGPNGGGLREAVNNLTITVSAMAEKVAKIGEDLARLSGEFHAQDK